MNDQRISFLAAVSTQDRNELVRTLDRTEVLITASPETLMTEAGQAIVYQMATLASRLFDLVTLKGEESISANQTLALLEGPFLNAVRNVCSELRPTSLQAPAKTIRVRVGDGVDDADLFVGATAWSALISHTTAQSVTGSGCPVGPLAAGTLGASEIFKLAFDGKIAHAVIGQDYSLSLLAYGADGGNEPIPADDLPFNLVLYGAGSIGTGFGHALALARQFRGSVAIVDNGRFDEKNPYKYSLLDWDTASTGVLKAPWLARRLKALSDGRLEALGYVGTAEQYVATLEADYRMPLAVSAVDTFEARFEIQDTLPKRIINAGIAGTTVEVSVHGFGKGPCLACIGMEAELESWQAVPIAQALGLNAGRAHELIRGNLPMEKADLEEIRGGSLLAPELIATLDTFLDQPLLSLWNRAAYSDVAVNVNAQGPQPLVSTAFVSAFAGILLLAELYKAADPALASYAVNNSYRQELLGIPANDVFQHPRESRGWCLCHSSFRLNEYAKKYD